MDEVRLSRVRLVTSRYRELHGLFTALIGCVFCVLAAIASLQPPSGYLAAAMIACFIAMLAGSQWIEQYYLRHFGRVRTSAETTWRSWIWVVGFSAASALDGNTLGNSLPATAPLLIGLHSLWVVFRDWPLRSYHVVVVVAGMLTSLLYCRATEQTRADWFIAAGFLLGIAFIVAGMGDHRLLASILDNPEAQLESSSDEQSV
jgi:hypothetical protein